MRLPYRFRRFLVRLGLLPKPVPFWTPYMDGESGWEIWKGAYDQLLGKFPELFISETAWRKQAPLWSWDRLRRR